MPKFDPGADFAQPVRIRAVLGTGLAARSILLVAHTAPLGYVLSTLEHAAKTGSLSAAASSSRQHGFGAATLPAYRNIFRRFGFPRITPTLCVNGGLADFSSDWR